MIPSSTSGKKKREILEAILAFMKEPVAVPQQLASALDHGFINRGAFYPTRRDLQLNVLIEFGEAWKALDEAERLARLADAWAFKECAFSVPLHSAYGQREGLLHLVHTDAFEAIGSREHKQLIAKRYSSFITEPTDDVDRQLEQVREGLTPTFGAEFDFYGERVRPQWQGGGTGAWDDFVKWARKFYEAPWFDRDERDYKLEAIAPLTRRGPRSSPVGIGAPFSARASQLEEQHDGLARA